MVKKNTEHLPRLVIEAGHIYMTESVTDRHLKSARIGAYLARSLAAIGYPVSNALFVDNYNEKPTDPEAVVSDQTLDVQEYLSKLRGVQFEPGTVLFEADMLPIADEIVSKLEEKEVACIDKRRKNTHYLIEGGMYLIEKGRYTCSLLDAALTTKKFEFGDVVINVLPYYYRPQQKKMKRILGQLGFDTKKVISVLYDRERIEPVCDDKPDEAVSNILSIIRMLEIIRHLNHDISVNLGS